MNYLIYVFLKCCEIENKYINKKINIKITTKINKKKI